MAHVIAAHDLPADGDTPQDLAVGSEGPCSDPLSRWWLALGGAVWLVLCFIQSWGRIVDDTKLPLLVSPIRYLAESFNIWNQQVFGGSVGQTGLVFPMGFFFAGTHFLHIPTWCAERIWLGLLLTIGFWGVVRIAEALGIGTPSARVLAGVAYCIAPIVVTWAQTSTDLLAVVLLPWMLVPLITGSRTGSPRRAAARSGIAVALMGGANGAVIFATLPVALIWLATRSGGPRRRRLFTWWLVALGLATFWWLVALALAGKYGFNYLPYTETSTVTTKTASAFEALRGASYWLGYYSLKTPLLPGVWTLVSKPYAIIGTTAVAALGLAGLCRRIPERVFLISTLTLGFVVISVGYAGALAGPFSHAVQHLLQTTLAPFRNISKFSPDVDLPLALGLAWCVSQPLRQQGTGSPHQSRSKRGRSFGSTSMVLLRFGAMTAIVLAAAPFWQRQLYPPGGFKAIPNYWVQAGNWLDLHQGHENAMVVPGASFGTYTWGFPSDEPLQVVSDTSIEWRNLIPIASKGYIQMLDAVETVLDNGVATPGLATYLSRGGVRYVIERNDLNWRTAGAPPPAQVHQVLADTKGLTQVASFGPRISQAQTANSDLPVYDTESDSQLREVEIFEVQPASSIAQTYAASDPVVVSGDVGSLLPLSAAGVISNRASFLSGDPAAPGIARTPGATWAITDGNQLRYTGFGTIRYNESYLLSPGQVLSTVVPDIPKNFDVVGGLSHETVSDPIGGAVVSASSYGSTYLLDDPSQGPASAFDNESTSAWVADAANRSKGQWVQITFDREVPMSSIVLTPLRGNQFQPDISRVTLSTSQGSVQRYIPASSTSVRLTVPRGDSRFLRITIDEVKGGLSPTKAGAFALGAGITHISIPGVAFEPRMKVPDDEASEFSSPSRNTPVISFSRVLANPNLDLNDELTDDPEMARLFTLPNRMQANITGYAIASTEGSLLQSLMQSQSAPPTATSVQVTASSWLANAPRFRPQNVVDSSGRPWIAGVNSGSPTLTLSWKEPRTVSSISLTPTPLASRPTEISITDGSGVKLFVPVPLSGGVLHFRPLTTNTLTIAFVGMVPKVGLTPDFGVEFTLPVGLSHISIPGLDSTVAPSPDKTFRLGCGQGPPLRIDHTTVPTEMTGTVGDLLDFKPIPFTACVPKGGVPLAAGSHTLSAPAEASAFLDTSILIRSGPSVQTAAPKRTVRIIKWNADARTMTVTAGPATYLVVAQNYNAGWLAKLDGTTLRPDRVDGWQQGFEIPAGRGGVLTLTMAPDFVLHLALVIGALFLLLLGVLALTPGRRRQLRPSRTVALPLWGSLGATLFILTLVAGPLSLVALPLFALARKWGTHWMAAVTFAAFSMAGIAVAVQPARLTHFGGGAFGATAQAASIVAMAAVLCVLSTERKSPDQRAPDSLEQGPGTGRA
jgi:arabinofuranan 3-O-arabinosyltransferase